MKYSKLGRFGVLFLTLLFAVGTFNVPSLAATSSVNVLTTAPTGATPIATQDGKATVQLWHYSGGYWGIHTSIPFRIYDSEITGNLETLADMMDRTVDFTYTMPAAVTMALNNGKKIGVAISNDLSYSYYSTSRGAPQTTVSGSTLTIKLYPKFHLLDIGDYSYDDFVDGLNKRIPFVDPKYGMNCYSVFKTSGGGSLGAAYGYFDPANPMQLGGAGTIHPSQIKNNNGYLKTGSTVTVGGNSYSSDSVAIGSGTFQNAGAVGLNFIYNLTLTYYEIDDNDVAVTSITPTLFNPEQSVGVQVIVKNQGTKTVTTPVSFQACGTNTRQNVTLAPNESKTLTFTFTTPTSGSFPMTAEINPDRTFTESNYMNNKLTVTGQVRNDTDVAVTKIEKTSYPATSVVTADVTVKNLGSKAVTTPVEFSIPGLITQTQTVTLAAEQTQVLHFKFSTPASGTLTMTAEANKSRTFVESNYANNKMTVTATIIPAPTGSTSCSDTITWTENDSHYVPSGFWYDGYWYDTSYTCYHTFTYETKLTASYNISPTTLKSGYGFAVTVNNSISTRMVSNVGCSSWGSGRANTKIPTTPDKAQVKLGWTVKNTRGTQPSTVDLNLIYRTSSQSKFEPKQNPISEIGSKLIFTDVALAGTKTSPKQQQFIISITGGGVNGIPFCKEFTDRITINGSIYEDDATGHN